ncbi:murein hydrolase activator EnvC [Alkalilimnicola ehrlichii]|uniref:murein hydrolase activator EnvC family protein n=1 Tax=Alkalilimnicola ehrlichii TaxID=351052 RepID=UPI0015F257B9|nr:peptidoglycan DD-metalloendopeptidase family protein [Alkalilimnicola ehrlichii]
MREQIERVQGGLQQERRRQDRVTRELRELDTRVNAANARLRRLDDEQVVLNRRINVLQGQRREQLEELAAQREHLTRQILDVYISGRQEYLRLLLNQEDPNSVDRMLVYYDYLNRARSERIQEVDTQLAELRRIEAEIAEQEERLATARRGQEAERTRLQTARQERAALLARIERELSNKDRQLRQLARDEEQLVELLQGLERALADVPDRDLAQYSFRESEGLLVWPVEGELAARFGSSRGAGGNSRWNGLLIEAEEGTDVRAISHGRVVFADWLRGFGLMVIIDHGEGFMSLYGHNEALYREAGAWVQPGEIIAAVGTSGGRGTPGLYFEVRENGTPVDPMRWLR